MKLVVALALLLLITASAVMAGRKAPLPPSARPAKRLMFASALAGAQGIGWLGYQLLSGSAKPLTMAAAGLLAAAGTLGIALSARAMLRALRQTTPKKSGQS